MNENTRINKAFERSSKLTKGYRMRIAGLYIVYFIIISLVIYMFNKFSSINMFNHNKNFIETAGNVLIKPIYTSMLVIVYYTSRIEKEEYKIEHLVDNFEKLD